jgi:hypothetical protein
MWRALCCKQTGTSRTKQKRWARSFKLRRCRSRHHLAFPLPSLAALYFFSRYSVSLQISQTSPSTLPARIRPLKRPNWPVFDPGKASTVCWRSIIIARDSGALIGTEFGHGEYQSCFQLVLYHFRGLDATLTPSIATQVTWM